MSLSINFIEKLLQRFESVGQSKTLSKGDFLIKEGQLEHYIYYIESGAVRVFLLTEFEEQIIRFGYEGSLINSLSSFIKGTPSAFYIEAVRKTQIKLLHKKDLLDLVNTDTETQKEYIALLENLITEQIEREIDLLTVSPSQRLDRVLSRSPNLFQQIPLKYIASYLRMTPETLSRIRKS